MSYTDNGSESDRLDSSFMMDQTVNNNFELNSNVSLTQMPNHGYTSGFTEIANSPSNKVKRSSKVKIPKDIDSERDEAIEKIKSNMCKSGSREDMQTEQNLIKKRKVNDSQFKQSDSNQRKIINYKQVGSGPMKRSTAKSDSSGTVSSDHPRKRQNPRDYDLINPMMGSFENR